MKNSKLLILILPLLTFTLSCKKEIVDITEDPSDKVGNPDINDWIYKNMKDYYLWESEMPLANATTVTLEPDDYFESLLYKFGDVDRFSWIEQSSEELRNSLNGLNRVFGWKYQPFYADNAQTKIAYAIQYTLKNSAAERVGIKRGDFVTKVDGKDLTLANYREALANETVTLTMGTYKNGEIVSTDVTYKITKEVTQTNALQFYKIIQIEGKRVGYFVYTQFLTSSDKDINKMFGEFKSNAIDELVVDLRFNPGGYISSAELLSSLIVKNLNSNNLMSRQIWNDKQMKNAIEKGGSGVYDTKFFINHPTVGSVNNPGTLKRAYFLVSNGSASASELLINNLKPYMDVILVGNHTYGKNVGSITIDDDSDPKRWEWGMQPIVLRSVNALGNSDYGTKNGFLPDVAIDDKYLPFKDFGSTDETFLNAALKDMFGAQVISKVNQNLRKVPTSIFKPLIKESISGNPLVDRKEMWVDHLPGEK